MTAPLTPHEVAVQAANDTIRQVIAAGEPRTFRDAIAAAVHTVPILYLAEALDAAYLILAMPEMQAIRTCLLERFVAKNPAGAVDSYSLASGMHHMSAAGLPSRVIDWVLSDENSPGGTQ